MSKGKLELTVGIFVLIGLACLTYLAVHLGKMEVFGKGYRVSARFDNISGLKTGAAVEVAGQPGQAHLESQSWYNFEARCHRLHPHQGHHR